MNIFAKYQSQSNTVFTSRHSVKVTTANKRIKDGHKKYPDDWVYQSVQFQYTQVSNSTSFDPFDVNPDDPFDTNEVEDMFNDDDEDPFDYDDDDDCDKDYVPEAECQESESEQQIESQTTSDARIINESEYISETDCSGTGSEIIPLQATLDLNTTTEPNINSVPRQSQRGKLEKRQFCVFCKIGVLTIARHLTTKHKNELEVAKLLAAKESKTRYKEYLLGIHRLKCRGNFSHNIEVLASGGSDIVVSKRPSKSRPASDFLPCMYCCGFFVSEELWKHVKNCELRDCREAYDYRKTLSLSRALLESAILPDGVEESWAREVRECVLSRMTQDNIYRAVKKDKLILRFGAILVKKLGKAKALDISQRMRQLGRLLLSLLQIDATNDSLEHFISGECFDAVIKATEEMCGVMTTDDGRRVFKTPSFAIRLGHLLVKIGNVKRGCSLRNLNESGRLAAETFLSLMKSEWTDAVSSCALNTLKRRKDHQVQILPLTEDLLKVKDHMVKGMDRNVKAVLCNHDYCTWRKLAQMTMARLILFNKQRGGEVSRLLLRTYQNRPKWQESMNDEILSSLQGLELTLIKGLDLIQVPGKKNRKVPILVTQETKTAMEALINTRESVGIPEKNPFFFASRSVDGYLNSWQAMKAVVDGANVESPMSISSTRLRKYIATVCQLFDLKEGEMEWLANHMGHELNIHRDFYRLHESTVEIAKVSRVLMAIDSGQARKYTGKSLDEIGLDDITFQPDDFVQDEGEDPNDVAQEEPLHETYTVTDQQPCAASGKKNMSSLDSSSDEEVTSNKKRKKIVASIDTSSSDEEITKVTRHSSISVKKKWNMLELSTLKSAFNQFLRDKNYPSGQIIKDVITKHPPLKNRTIPQIRSKLQHLMR